MDTQTIQGCIKFFFSRNIEIFSEYIGQTPLYANILHDLLLFRYIVDPKFDAATWR